MPHALVTGRALYPAKETGQFRRDESVPSGLQIHELENGSTLCDNKPAPGKVLANLGHGSVTCRACETKRRLLLA